MTNTIDDLEKADVILVTGSNTTENHPVISSYIKRAVSYLGKKLIVIDPRKIKLTEFSDIYLQPTLGTDVAWINGLMNVIISEGLADEAFIAERTNGYEDLKKAVEKFTPEYVEGITGIPADDIISTARMYAGAEKGSIVYCMGITQHISGTDNVKSLANLAMLCGNMGIEGGGVNPLRGQNNVQGACDMGGLPNVFTGYQKVIDPDAVKKMEDAWGVEGLSDKNGITVTQMLPKAHEGDIKALYIIGENPMVSDPDLNHAEDCLKHLDFLLVQDIFLTETAKLADVVLPAKCFAEKDGTFSNTERRVQRIRAAVDGPGDVRDDWDITCEIGTRMGFEMKYDNASDIFDEIARVTPSYGGLDFDRIEETGLHWPCPTKEHPGTPVLHIGKFTSGKGTFHAIEFVPPAELPDDDYPLYLTTGRVLYQYHTGTMTRKTDDINERAPESFVELCAEDADKYGLANGELVEVSSRRGTIKVRARVCDMTKSGTVFIPFHFAEAAANMLTNAALDPVSQIPELKVCAVKLTKVA